MRDYTSANPVFSDSISIVEERDLVNENNANAAVKQLLQNILVLQMLKVDKVEGMGLISDAERTLLNAIYPQATAYVEMRIADLINGAPSTLDTLGEIADAMADNKDVVAALDAAIGTKASQTEMESMLGTKLDKTGDSKDNTLSFGSSDTTTPSSWTDVDVIKSGETHKNLVQKIVTMIKNVRFLRKFCGSNDISSLGDGTITGAITSLNTRMGGFSEYPGLLTQAEYDALPEETKLAPGVIFNIIK